MRCPDCKKQHVTKIGTVMTKSKGRRPRYKCSNCGRTFYGKDGKKG